MGKFGVVGVARIPVECSILRLEKRKQTSTNKSLSVQRCTQVVGRVAAGGDISDVNNCAKGILRALLETLFLTFITKIVFNLHHPSWQ